MSQPVAAVRLGLATVVLAVAALGCESPPTTTTASPASQIFELQVMVRDGAVRALDAECAGAAPFLYVHMGAAYRIAERPDGTTVMSGALPAGRAVPAFEGGLGIPREPSFCLFSWMASLDRGPEYQFMLEEGDPVPFDLDSLDEERRITIVLP